MYWSYCVKQFDWCAGIVWNSLIDVPVLCETVWLVCRYCVKQFNLCACIVWNSLIGVPLLCKTVWLVCLYCVKQFDWCACIVWNCWNGVAVLCNTVWFVCLCSFILFFFWQLNVITCHQWWKCVFSLLVISLFLHSSFLYTVQCPLPAGT